MELEVWIVWHQHICLDFCFSENQTTHILFITCGLGHSIIELPRKLFTFLTKADGLDLGQIQELLPNLGSIIVINFRIVICNLICLIRLSQYNKRMCHVSPSLKLFTLKKLLKQRWIFIVKLLAAVNSFVLLLNLWCHFFLITFHFWWLHYFILGRHFFIITWSISQLARYLMRIEWLPKFIESVTRYLLGFHFVYAQVVLTCLWTLDEFHLTLRLLLFIQ